MNESDEKLRQLIAENIAYYRKLNGDTQDVCICGNRRITE